MSRTALVVVDVLSTYDHEDADRLAETAREALPAVRRLLERARDQDVLTVYVNDNFGVWNAGRAEIVEHVRPGDRFAELVEPLLPPEDTDLEEAKQEFTGEGAIPDSLIPEAG